MEGLRVDMHRLPQLWQRLAARLSQQTEMEGGELLEVPHVVEQAAIVGAVLVNEGHRRGGGAHAGHGDTSLQRSRPAYGVPDVTDEGSNHIYTQVRLPPWLHLRNSKRY